MPGIIIGGYRFVMVFVLVWFATPTFIHAHAALQDRLTALSDQIQTHPHDAHLYLKRGELHRTHQDWAAALADYQRAEQLAPNLLKIAYLRGRMWLEASRPDFARPALDRFLAVHHHHANALLTRSRVLSQLGEYLAAAEDLKTAMAQLTRPTPELYLERARVLVAAGPEYVDETLQTLDLGIARLGNIVTLIRYAVEIETDLGRYTTALARLETLPETIALQPVWLKRKGDLLRMAGQESEAYETYTTAMTALISLPPTRRRVRATSKLKTELQCLLGPCTRALFLAGE